MNPWNEQDKWNVADKDGNIDLPNELEPLFHKLGMQLRLHTISNKNEMATIVDMVYLSHKFFTENKITKKSVY